MARDPTLILALTLELKKKTPLTITFSPCLDPYPYP